MSRPARVVAIQPKINFALNVREKLEQNLFAQSIDNFYISIILKPSFRVPE